MAPSSTPSATRRGLSVNKSAASPRHRPTATITHQGGGGGGGGEEEEEKENLLYELALLDQAATPVVSARAVAGQWSDLILNPPSFFIRRRFKGSVRPHWSPIRELPPLFLKAYPRQRVRVRAPFHADCHWFAPLASPGTKSAQPAENPDHHLFDPGLAFGPT